MPAQPISRRTAAVLAALWAALLGLALRLAPDGLEHGDLGQAVGRLHPLLVHLPVALLLLVPLLEWMGRPPGRAHLREAAVWVLGLATAAAFLSAFDGWLLAWSEGLRGRDVSRHMWGGVWLCAACAAAWWAGAGRRTLAYPLLLAASVGVLVWTADGGGTLSHGEGYLTAKLPQPLRRLLGLPQPQPGVAAAPAAGGIKLGPGTSDPSNPAFYVLHVSPILARSCLPCHKPDKHKAGLRMDTYALLMKGGDNGAVISPGNPDKSDLLRRVRLPAADEDYMPSDGLRPLTPEEILTLERWIGAGARGG